MTSNDAPTRLSHLAACFVAALAVVQLVHAQQGDETEGAKESFQESVARAKQTGQPLVVFGVTDT